MTFKDIRKAIQSQAEAGALITEELSKGKPFWVFDREQHRRLHTDVNTKGHRCFNHTIGLPQKDGHDMPLLYDSLQNYKHIWIRKAEA